MHTGRAMRDNDEVSTGELYRICLRIETQVNLTNGRVTALERDAVRIKTLWSVAAVVMVLIGDYLKHRFGFLTP